MDNGLVTSGKPDDIPTSNRKMIEEIAEGVPARTPIEIRFGSVLVDMRLRRAWKGYETLELSSREFDLLEYLIAHAARTLTRDELLRAVWGYTTAPLTRTVDNFVAKLRKKLGDEPRPAAPPHRPRLRLPLRTVKQPRHTPSAPSGSGAEGQAGAGAGVA